jgi:hypothetical protein
MYLTDEFMDEMGTDLECPHNDTGMEPSSTVNRNGSVEMLLVCYDCGAYRPTGTYDSVL